MIYYMDVPSNYVYYNRNSNNILRAQGEL